MYFIILSNSKKMEASIIFTIENKSSKLNQGTSTLQWVYFSPLQGATNLKFLSTYQVPIHCMHTLRHVFQLAEEKITTLFLSNIPPALPINSFIFLKLPNTKVNQLPCLKNYCPFY